MPRLSFSLRDLFWLTLVVACLTGWWMDRSRIAAAEEKQKSADKMATMYGSIIDAYRRDGRLHSVVRKDGSVYITDKQVQEGFGPAEE